jgi:hypothetical protein
MTCDVIRLLPGRLSHYIALSVVGNMLRANESFANERNEPTTCLLLILRLLR